MHQSDIKDLAHFIDELNKETDRGLPLVAAALVDEKLLETLRSFFCNKSAAEKLLDESNAPLGTFSSRTEACFALGLIDEFEYKEISLIRKIRNEFARARHGMSFQNEKVSGLCSSLQSDLPEGAGYPTNEPRFRFTNAVVSVVLRLYYRPAWVKKERREPKTWVAEDTTRWRSVELEKPPVNVPFVAMGKRPKN